ncbi:GNAT family N-acetyltransferase [Parvularcula sp. LCG005]|uniref:GNAT family N-acetyltransferase n=1 Tax=Parvularcula sp. LCG005 TaxID=3078805 RepID=UPI0029426545|nr:GNAT family N-acetyltransferase [Parvularcula sp. LCG005]WOI53006.1 GNAT family N-acetyltransferase [Parvularcula sp. LCG005]
MPHSIRTDRLLLRPATLRDAPAIARAFGDREMAKSTKTWPHPVTVEHARFRIRQWMAASPNEQFGFALVYQGQAIGSLGFAHRYHEVWSVGYGIDRAHWGQGLVTEALKAACLFTFRTKRARKIEADVFQDNPGSQAVALKAGFRCIGDIGPGWSTVLQGDFPRFGYELKREWLRL